MSLKTRILGALGAALGLASSPAGAVNGTPISSLPIAIAVNPTTDYAVGIVQQIVNGQPSFGTYRVPLSVLVGPAGAAASFTSVSATTLAPGAQATATLGGAGPAYTLSFGIPAGTPGTGNVSTSGSPVAGNVPTFTDATHIGPCVAATCRSALGAAASGANGDITSLTGLTTPLSASQGGIGTGTASGTAVDNISGFSSTGIMSRTGAGAYSFSTESALLDVIGSTRGQILYRGASGWSVLATATAGQLLATGGVGADPSWTVLAVASDIQTGTNALKPVTAAALAGSQAFQTLTSASTVTWNGQSGYNAKVTLGVNATLAAITNPVEGQTYALQIIQPASGGPWTMAYNAAYDFGGACTPTLSTTASKIDMLYLQCINASTPLFKASFSKGT